MSDKERIISQLAVRDDISIREALRLAYEAGAVECRAPAPQPDKCGQRFTCAATGLRIYVCALEKGHEGDCDDHPTRGLAATPQVTPTNESEARKWCDEHRKHPVIGKAIQGAQSWQPDGLATIVAYIFNQKLEGTSEQASPTPEEKAAKLAELKQSYDCGNLGWSEAIQLYWTWQNLEARRG